MGTSDRRHSRRGGSNQCSGDIIVARLRLHCVQMHEAASPLTALVDKKRSTVTLAASRKDVDKAAVTGPTWPMGANNASAATKSRRMAGLRLAERPCRDYFAAGFAGLGVAVDFGASALSRVAMKLTTTAGASGADGSVLTTVPMNVSGCAVPTFQLGIRKAK